MQRGVRSVLASALLGSAALTPAVAFAAPPTCAELALNPAFGLAGNPNITATTSDNQGIASPSSTVVLATATNAAYCNVQIQFSSKSGPSYGYAPGESQTIGIGIGLPLNSTDGGTGGVEGAWNGKVENLGGGGLIGTIGSTTAATNAGFVGSSTDGGHNTSQNGGSAGNFGVIQSSHQLDTGKLTDFASEAQHQQYLWALAVAEKYYGRAATRNYWNGCSTGGRQGLELAQKWGEDFDGILAGAPVTYNLELDLSHIWPALVNRDDVVASGHPAITTGQYSAAVASAIAACDVQGTDVVADGVVDDPRQCTWHASNNICGRPGAPASPNCLDPVQAAGIDKIWDGARNHHGQRMWFPYLKNQTGGTFVLDPAFSSFQGLNAFTWNHRDLTFSAQNVYSTRKLAAANPLGQPAPIALEDEWVMLDGPGGAGNFLVNDDYQGIIDRVHFGHKHGKIIMWQGSADPFVPWQDSIHFYRAMATEFGDGKTDFAGLSSWYRYYHAPGVGHCGGGVGASPLAGTLPNGNSQIFDDLVKWVEHDMVPQSAGDSTHVGILATGPGSFGTRPICPFPTTAIYNGSGSTTVASNYHCGGNLESSSPTPATNNVVTICEDLVTVYGREDSNELDYKDLGITPGQCPRHDGGDHRADNGR
jgi:Tannase and feruloyl esterase